MEYDVCIIGSGWAGFNAAISCAKNNLSVCLIEKEVLGGTCLNYGCIPTKILVTSADVLSEIKNSSEFGIEVDAPRINFDKVFVRKEAVISRLRKGLEGLIKAKKINLRYGRAKILDPTHIEIENETIAAKNIIIASGCRPKELANLKFDHRHILSSTDLLNLREIPKSLLIIGGGVIGCEFASIYSRFGTKVTIVEILERLLAGEDREVSKKLEMEFKKKKVEVLCGTDFSSLDFGRFDKVLLSVGRAANIEDLGLDEAGIEYQKGKISVDEHLRTKIGNIYAVGDCASAYQLAHVASYEGRMAAENVLGENKKVDYTSIPNCIFTHPEIASVGLTEEKARNKGFKIKICKFDFLGLGMAHIKGSPQGFIKIVAEESSKQILGAVIFGIGATELISNLGLAIKNRLTISQLGNTIFAHPTLSEAIYEAADKFDAV